MVGYYKNHCYILAVFFFFSSVGVLCLFEAGWERMGGCERGRVRLTRWRNGECGGCDGFWGGGEVKFTDKKVFFSYARLDTIWITGVANCP